jgi:hypothetical protein
MRTCCEPTEVHRKVRSLAGSLATLAVVLFSAIPAVHAAGTATTTQLSVTPANPVTAGTPITLSATVVNPGPVTAGSVTLCDATMPSCAGPAALGTVQLTTSGMATMKLTLGVGAHQVKAVFAGTAANARSSSSPQTILVTGNASYATSMALTASGTPGNYTLSTQLTAFGKMTPSGTISFLDFSSGNAVISTVPTVASGPPQVMAALGSPYFTANAPFGSFTPAAGQLPVVGPQTWGVAVGDFNNDGVADLVTAGVGDGLLSVLIGNGNGTFKPRTTLAAPVGSDPSTMVVADFNRDGKQDIAVVNGFGGTETLTIFLGNGDGTFSSGVNYNAGVYAVGLAAGDFNGDGFVDLAIVDGSHNTINIMTGNGDGTFLAYTPFPVGNLPYSVVVGDFDQDGNLDLAVNNSDDGTVSVLFGNGDGTFQPQVTYAVGTAPRTLAIGDFNGDGFLDLAVTNFGSNTVSILLGASDRSGTFTVHTPAIAVGAAPVGVAIADFNGDGFTDLAVTNSGANSVSILLGKGDGTFQPQVAFTGNIGDSPYPVTIGDFNGDGLPDLAIANYANQSASILLGVQAETLTVMDVTVTGAGTHNVLASYPGDTVYAPSNSTTVPLVGLLATTTTLTSSAQSIPSGQPLTFTATVAAASGAPTGSVSFYDSTTLLGTATVNASCVATFTYTLSAGGHTVTATYMGDASFNRSTSAGVTVTVTTDIDFVVGSAQQSGMVNPGGKVSFAIVTVSVGGAYNSPVALSVTGLPPGATATFTPTSVTPGDNSATSIMTVQMPALNQKSSLSSPVSTPRLPLGPLPIASIITVLGWLIAGRMTARTAGTRRFATVAALVVLSAVVSGISGCQGGFIASPQQGFAVTVTGTSGAQVHSTTVMINVR